MRKGLHNKVFASFLALSVVVSSSGFSSVIGGKNVSAADGETELTKILEPEDIDFRAKWDDTSNITEGETHEVKLANGNTITIKDNGSVRPDMTAQQLADEQMGLGINVGNTLEAVQLVENKKNLSGDDYDKAWSNPAITREYIDCLHSYGINTVRIPVAWSNGDIDDGTYTIRTELLDRVEEVINYALDNGMYVIINDHWDNQWWGQFGACKRDEEGNRVADEETRANAWVRYERYWTQISERFKNYSDHLIFEGANEELGDRLNDAIVISDVPSKGYCKPNNAGPEAVTLSGNLTTQQCYETTNAINQKFVEIVRGTGGNNTSRFLMIPGYNTDFQATSDERFVMPKDSAENGTNKLFVSVHYYTPTDFCLDGPTGIYTTADQEATKNYFAMLKRFNDEGYAIVVGECGVVEPSAVSSSVTQCLYDEFTEAAKYHAVPVLWDTGAYFNRTEAKINYKDIAVLYNTINGANGSTDVDRETGGAPIQSGSSSEIPDYLDKEVWDTPGIHAYLFYQTSNWDYRNAYKPQRALSSGNHSWEYASAGSAELNAATAKVTDVLITQNGEYTVAIEGAGLSGNSFKMLGVSTSIDKKIYSGITMTNASIKIDGVNLKEEPFDLVWKEDDPYYDFMVINEYNADKLNHPLGPENDAQTLKMPENSIEITFTINGLDQVLADIADGSFVDPETGLPLVEPSPSPTPTPPVETQTPAVQNLKKGDTFTSGNYKYKVTKVASGSNNGTVALQGLTAKGKSAKKLTVAASVKGTDKNTYTIASLGKKAFSGAKATSITLNKSIKNIPSSAFAKCTKLDSLTLKTKLTGVSKNAFNGCKKKIKVKGTAKKANKKLLKKTSYKKFG